MRNQTRYNAAVYCRLSKDDDIRSTGSSGGGESGSIISQKEIIEKYVHDNGWHIYDYYVDEPVIIGTSGENLVKSRGSALVPISFLLRDKPKSFKSLKIINERL